MYIWEAELGDSLYLNDDDGNDDNPNDDNNDDDDVEGKWSLDISLLDRVMEKMCTSERQNLVILFT